MLRPSASHTALRLLYVYTEQWAVPDSHDSAPSGMERKQYRCEWGAFASLPASVVGGEQQPVAIARALAKDAPEILADEPTGELDFRTGVRILDSLNGQAEAGKTVIIVTHNREIAWVAHRVVELHDGQVTSDGPQPGCPVPVDELTWTSSSALLLPR